MGVIEWLNGPMVGDRLTHGCCMRAMMLVRMGAVPQSCEGVLVDSRSFYARLGVCGNLKSDGCCLALGLKLLVGWYFGLFNVC